MHKIVIEELEAHLAGRASAAFREHLAQCGDCRGEVGSAAEIAAMLRSFRAQDEEPPPEPRPGFYRRVEAEVVARQQSAGWGLFAPGAVFFRRVAFASLLLLAGFGSYLISYEPEFSVNDATAIIARHVDEGGAFPGSGAPMSRDQILAALADWSE